MSERAHPYERQYMEMVGDCMGRFRDVASWSFTYVFETHTWMFAVCMTDWRTVFLNIPDTEIAYYWRIRAYGSNPDQNLLKQLFDAIAEELDNGDCGEEWDDVWDLWG